MFSGHILSCILPLKKNLYPLIHPLPKKTKLKHRVNVFASHCLRTIRRDSAGIWVMSNVQSLAVCLNFFFFSETIEDYHPRKL